MRHFIAEQSLTSVSLIGYSMGGNLVLKLAGELGSAAPAQLRSVIGVSPAIDLGPSADALHEPWNRVYEIKFLRALLQRYRRKVALFPRAYDPNRADGIRSIREFDDRITAFYSGFTSADDYYHRAASARVIGRIAVPTLLLNAADDPFVRLLPESRALIAANPHITFVESPNGGHCAFLAAPHTATGYDGYWAEHTLLRYLLDRA
jgi:predicted alpha/beta-fold hydrolase